jgi:polysaccharide biosynthesis protein VpsM
MKSKLAIMTALAFASAGVQAVDPQAIKTESGFDITPLLSTGLKYDDNITSVSANETDSWIMTVLPSVKASRDDGVTSLEFSAAAYHGNYFSSSSDNFTDTLLGGLFDTQLSEQGKLNVKADMVWGHEDRGTGITEGLNNNLDDPTRFNNQTLSGYYEYGAVAAPARVRFGARYFNKEYMNQRETSIVDIGYDFVDPEASRDSKETNVKAGAEWQISALTSGEFKLGYQKKEFDDSTRDDFSGVAWTVNANWSPLTYSNFDFGTGRRSKDPLQGGDYIKETTYTLRWNHNWSEALQTQLTYNRLEEDYVGINREDENDSYTASIKYAFRRFVDVSLFTTATDKTSSVPGIEFDRNIVGVNFDFSL